MKFSSTSPFKKANKRPKDFSGGAVQLNPGSTSHEGTILRAVPERSPRRTQTNQSPQRRPKHLSLEYLQEDVHPGTRVYLEGTYPHPTPVTASYVQFPLESPRSPQYDSAEEIHPDFLGVWSDGTTYWAEESEAISAEAESQRVASWIGLSAPPPRNSATKGLSLSLSRRSLRPKIRVSIPRLSQSRSTARRVSGLNVASRPVSTARISAAVTAAVDRQSSPLTSTVPASLAISSKLEQDEQIFVMETTPLAQQNLQLDSSEMLPELSGSSISPSSDEHVDDDRSSVYSGKSSQSSICVAAESKSRNANARDTFYSILTPTIAGVFDEVAMPPTVPSTPRIPPAARSQASLADCHNKPLPPEPLYMAPPPLVVAGRPCARNVAASSPSRSTRSNSPFGEPIQSRSLPGLASAPRRIPQRQVRPKQSVAELDAIDLAFRQASPKIERPTLTEAEEALELHLSTITEQPLADEPAYGWDETKYAEDTAYGWEDMPLHNPVQIARGPMDMAPSRAPPVPPLYFHENVEIGAQKDVRFTKAHMMPEPGSYPLDEPSITMARRLSRRSRWSLRAQRTFSRSLPEDIYENQFIPSPVIHRSLPTTPHSNPTNPGGTDPALLEIQKRLELVKMKERSDAFRLEAIRLADSAEAFRRPIHSEGFVIDSIPEHQAPSVIVRSHDTTGETTARQSCVDRESTPSLAAITFSDVPELYVEDMSTGELMDPEAVANAEKQRTVSAQAAETVLLKVLWNLPNLKDLFSAAVVSRGFYRTFKKNELPLTKNALKGMSPAAWELREVSPPFPDGNDLDVDQPVPEYTPQSYLRFYTRDLYIMVALKSLMLVRCEEFLRPETISALAGNDDERSLQLDDAFWRVWTFCKIFGSHKGRENDISGQLDWLRGGPVAHKNTCSSSTASPDPMLSMDSALHNPPESFGLGNGAGGLDASQLYDMKEIWSCLRALIQGFRGRRDDARDYGVFDNQGVVDGDVDAEGRLLTEWISYILTLGPSVILDLATPSDQSGPQGFSLAQENGWTEWEAPCDSTTRSNFLEEAVTKLYDEKMAAMRIPERSLFRQPTLLKPMTYSPQKKKPSTSNVISPAATVTLHPPAPASAPTPAPKPKPRRQGLSKVQQTILSIEEKSVGAQPPKPSKTPMTTILPRKLSSGKSSPSHLYSLSRTRSIIKRKTSTKSLRSAPSSEDLMIQTIGIPYTQHTSAGSSRVDDPVDRAVRKMVSMGFGHKEAMKALAVTDTGENLNVKAAIELARCWREGE